MALTPKVHSHEITKKSQRESATTKSEMRAFPATPWHLHSGTQIG